MKKYDYPKAATNRGGVRNFCPSRKTNTRTAAEAQAAKMLAMNRDGIGTEINRSDLSAPYPIGHGLGKSEDLNNV